MTTHVSVSSPSRLQRPIILVVCAPPTWGVRLCESSKFGGTHAYPKEGADRFDLLMFYLLSHGEMRVMHLTHKRKMPLTVIP